MTELNESLQNGELTLFCLRLLLDASAKGVVILLLAFFVSVMLRRVSASSRHLLWLMAVLSLLVLPVTSLVMPVWQWRILPDSMRVDVVFAGDMTPLSPPATVMESQGMLDSNDSFITPPPETALTRSMNTPMPSDALAESVEVQEQVHTTVSAADSLTPAVDEKDTPIGQATLSIHWSVWIMLAWLTGVVIVAAPYAIGSLRARKILKGGRSPEGERWADLQKLVSERLSLGRRVCLILSDRIRIPMTWGVLHPVILLPEDAGQWSPERLRMVLLHELAHIHRWDCLTQILGQAACALYWFNPLVWLAYRRMVLEREQACDDAVVAAGMAPSAYADQLYEIVRSLHASRARFLAGVSMARRSQIEGRLLAILDATRHRRRLTRRVVAAGLLLTLMTTLPLGSLRLAAKAAGETPVSDTGAGSSGEVVKNAVLDETAITLMAMGRRDADRIDWWTPGGEPTRAPDVVTSQATHGGIYALFRVEREDVSITPYCLRASSMLPFRSFDQIGQTEYRLGLIDFPPECHYLNIMLDVNCDPWITIYKLPLTQDDMGRPRIIGDYLIDRIEGLRAVDEQTLHVRIIHELDLPGTRFAAIDHQGRAHAPREEDHARKARVSELTFDLSVNELRAIARQHQTGLHGYIHNVSLLPGLKSNWSMTLAATETLQQESEKRRAELLKAAQSTPFTYKLPNEITVQILGVGRLADAGPQWWTPEGTPTRVAGVREADLEGDPLVVACRVLGKYASWRSYQVEGRKLNRLEGTRYARNSFIWLAPLTAPESAETAGIALEISGGPYEELARVPLSVDDRGRDIEVNAHNIDRITGLRRRSASWCELQIVSTFTRDSAGRHARSLAYMPSSEAVALLISLTNWPREIFILSTSRKNFRIVEYDAWQTPFR